MADSGITTVPLDDEPERRRITTTGLGETLFVEAGAGTGKTSQLVARIVNLVVRHGVPLASIAAITFTEAAATELRDRIRVAFERLVAEHDDPAVVAVAAQALDDADQAAFTTLHGFALRMLSEYPTAAGLPPRISVADEVTSQLMGAERWQRFVDRLYERADLVPLLLRAAVLGIPLEPAYTNQVTMRDIAVILNQSWDRLIALGSRPVDPLPEVDFGGFDRAVQQLAGVSACCTDPTDKLAVWLADNLAHLRATVGLTDPLTKLRALGHLPKRNSRFGRKQAWSIDVDQVRQLAADVDGEAQRLRGAAANAVLQRLATLIAGEVLAAAEERRRTGTVEFHDLLVLARQALRTSPSMRQRLGQRYQHLLLDEFQDTDPLQIELAVLLAGVVDDPSAEWQDIAVPPGRLFFVGDPKQSIYRFRRADIRLFLEARDAFGGPSPHPALVRLRTNFRTVSPIIDWVNELFAGLMPEEQTGRQPKYQALVAHRHPPQRDRHRVMLLGGPVEGPASEVRRVEAAHVGAVLDDIAARPEQWPVEDANGWRPARLSDVVILVPARTSLPFLRTELDRRDLPYRLDTGTLVFDAQEIRDLLATMRAIDDSSDEISLVAALRSPLYGCSDVDLYTWRQAGGRWNIGRQPPAELAQHPVGQAIAHLHSVWAERWWLSASALLARLVGERRAMMAGFGDPRPQEVWRRVRFLMDQARAYDATQGGGVRGFCEWAALQASSAARVHEPLAADTDVQAVRILTVHGAKGLEFPITILSGMSAIRSSRRQFAEVVWEGDAPEIKIGAHATQVFDTRAEVEDEMDAAERIRLLYVATTRARDHLVVSCVHNARGTHSFAGVVHAAMAERTDLHRPAPGAIDPVDIDRQPADPSPVDPAAAAEREAGSAQRAERRDRLRAPRVWSATAVATEQRRRDTSRTEPVGGVDDADEPEVTDEVDDRDDRIVGRRGRAGTAIGRAVHATLQSLDLAMPPGVQLVDAIVERECWAESVPDAAATVRSMVDAALGSEALALARRSPHHQELYVAAELGGRLVEGYVDLLIETPEGLVIVDYKTDAVRSEAEIDAKLASYEVQGAAYAVAVQAACGLAVADCRFVFCRPGGAVERRVADLAGAMQRVAAMLIEPMASSGPAAVGSPAG